MASTPESVFEAAKAYIFEAPTYHIALEAILVTWILYLLFFSKQYRPESKHDKLTKEEEEALLAEWQPEPLVPDVYPKDREVDPAPIVTGIAGPHMTVNGKECLNLATYNFLGLLGNQTIKEAAANSIRKYGVGSCGPRGFYGTVDIHLELEERLAKFLGMEEAILYSYGFAAISSAIPAYSKRRDIIFSDEGVCFPIQKGLIASRSKIKYFKHNDMADLERLLEEQKKQDERNPAKAKVTRKFIVAEAMYMNYGDLVPLPKLVELRNKYRVPMFLDESLTFGVLGENGKGATEHFGIPGTMLAGQTSEDFDKYFGLELKNFMQYLSERTAETDDVDIICVSLDMAVASVGGFCAGKSYVIDHQRLSGLGYCFSASLPPMLAQASIEALNLFKESSEMFVLLRRNAERMRELLKGVEGLECQGEVFCPLIHLRLTNPSPSWEDDQQVLEKIAEDCLTNGVAITTAKYLKEELNLPPPSIRLTVCSEHSEEELSQAAAILREAVAKHLPSRTTQ